MVLASKESGQADLFLLASDVPKLSLKFMLYSLRICVSSLSIAVSLLFGFPVVPVFVFVFVLVLVAFGLALELELELLRFLSVLEFLLFEFIFGWFHRSKE